MDALTIIIVLALLSTFVALLFGLAAMGKGGAFDSDFGEKFMWARIIVQGLAVVLLLLALWLH